VLNRLPLRLLVVGVLLVGVLLAPMSADEGTSLDGLQGGRLTSNDLAKGTVILVVWASWSPRCRDIVTRLNQLDSAWSSKARLVSVVFQEEPAVVKHFLEGHRLEGHRLGPPVYVDRTGAFSKKHAVSTVPWLLIFQDGQITFRGKLPTNPGPVIQRALG
jgi:thiol-disulfide isomerase/thioredoxin